MPISHQLRLQFSVWRIKCSAARLGDSLSFPSEFFIALWFPGTYSYKTHSFLNVTSRHVNRLKIAETETHQPMTNDWREQILNQENYKFH